MIFVFIYYIEPSDCFMLLGGRDKRGGAILSFLAYQPIVDKLKYDDLRMLITYLASIPR